jgi:hypothetical protein
MGDFTWVTLARQLLWKITGRACKKVATDGFKEVARSIIIHQIQTNGTLKQWAA